MSLEAHNTLIATQETSLHNSTESRQEPQSLPAAPTSRRCYICNGTDHIAKYCKATKSDSGRNSHNSKNTATTFQPGAKKVEGGDVEGDDEALQPDVDSILQLLYSDTEDSDESVNTIRVNDRGSLPQCVHVLIQDVPVYGIIDTAADITIIGGQLFCKVASVAHQKKKHFKPSLTRHHVAMTSVHLDWMVVWS